MRAVAVQARPRHGPRAHARAQPGRRARGGVQAPRAGPARDPVTTLTLAAPQVRSRVRRWPPKPPSHDASHGSCDWVDEAVALCEPDDVHWCDGSARGVRPAVPAARRRGHVRAALRRQAPELVSRAARIPATSRASRTARSSARSREEDAGPTNNWRDPAEMRATAARRSSRGVHARPHDVRRAVLHGPARLADLRDRRAADRLRLRRRVDADHDPHGAAARSTRSASDGDFVPCMHTRRRAARARARRAAPWPCNEEKYIVHFPETREIWSYGSGYGGNALLGKKCFALRIASVMARDEGWLAEHMLILKLTSPEGGVKYVTGAFPSACGKTNLAMLIPAIEGWTVETVGDDIAWMKFGDDGRLLRDQPGGRLLRRRARARAEKHEPERDGHGRARTRSSPTARRRTTATSGGRGMTERAAGAPDRLARATTGRRSPTTPAAHPERALHRRRRRRTRRSRPSGRTRRACRSTRSCSAAAAPPSCRSCTRRSTGSTASSSARSWAPRRRPRRRATSASCAATRSRCCRSAATTWRDYFAALARDRPSARAPCCRGSSTSTGSARTRRRPLPVAGLRRQRARARVGVPPLRRRGRRGGDRRSGRVPDRRARCDTDGLDITRAGPRTSCCASMPPSGAEEIEPIREFYAQVRRQAARRAHGPARPARGARGRRGPLNRPRDARVSAPRSPADQAANTADRGRGPGPA